MINHRIPSGAHRDVNEGLPVLIRPQEAACGIGVLVPLGHFTGKGLADDGNILAVAQKLVDLRIEGGDCIRQVRLLLHVGLVVGRSLRGERVLLRLGRSWWSLAARKSGFAVDATRREACALRV